jgi:hypothetical protein
MFRRQVYSRPKLAMIAAALVMFGIVSAGPATADQAQDDQYFAALQQIYAGRPLDQGANVGNAHQICDHLGRGESIEAVANALRASDHNRSSLEQSQQEVHLAQSTYCP